MATVVSAARLRETAGLFATGVTIITARDDVPGNTRGMTANAFMSVSLEPPLIVVSVANRARMHRIIATARRYGVTLLGSDLEAEARRFASMQASWTTDPELPPAKIGERLGVPILEGGVAWMVAEVDAAHAAGDHTLFVGQVLGTSIERPEQPPLAFHRSVFGEFLPFPSATPVPLDAWSFGDRWG